MRATYSAATDAAPRSGTLQCRLRFRHDRGAPALSITAAVESLCTSGATPSYQRGLYYACSESL